MEIYMLAWWRKFCVCIDGNPSQGFGRFTPDCSRCRLITLALHRFASGETWAESQRIETSDIKFVCSYWKLVENFPTRFCLICFCLPKKHFSPTLLSPVNLSKSNNSLFHCFSIVWSNLSIFVKSTRANTRKGKHKNSNTVGGKAQSFLISLKFIESLF